MSKTAIFCCFQSLAVCEAFFLLSLEISGANNLTKKGDFFFVFLEIMRKYINKTGWRSNIKEKFQIVEKKRGDFFLVLK